MKYTPNPISRLAFILIVFGSISANAAINVRIQPSEDGTKTYFTVSWDSLSGSNGIGDGPWPFHSPVDHSVVGSSKADYREWPTFGDFKSDATREVFFRSESPSYVSSVSGFGIHLDNDEEGDVGDDFGLTFTGGTVPASGSFVAETDTYEDGFSAMWKEGEHLGPSGSLIEVSAVPIPEPSSCIFMGLSALAVATLRRRSN